MSSDAMQLRDAAPSYAPGADAQDVPLGHKRTEAGVIPEDWEVTPVWDLGKFTSGASISVAKLRPQSSDSPVPVYGGNGVAGYTDQALVLEPTVVLGRVGQKCGAVLLTHGPAWITDNALYPRRLAPSIDVRFLALVLENAGLNNLRNRNDLPLLTQGILRTVSVGWPPSRIEQGAIAEALSDVDGLLGALETLIAKKRAIKQAAMQQLLTGKTRLPGFSGEWETKRLGEIGEISAAGVDKKTRPNEVPVWLLNYLDVYHKTFLRSIDLEHVVSAKPDHARRCMILKGDVFFTPTSEVPDDIGRSAVAMEDIEGAAYSYHVVRLRLTVDWDLCFRAYAFGTKAFLDEASRTCEGSGTRYVITLPRFRALPVHFPTDVSEQSAIATALSDMDGEIAALEARRDKTRAIKQGMMQQLLTGRVRLVKPEAPA
jgi:type I restriction enzyme, S subunit